MIDLEKERKAFENNKSVRISLSNYVAESWFVLSPNKIYTLQKTQFMWLAWLECAASKQAEIDALKAQIAELEKPKSCIYEDQLGSSWLVGSCGNQLTSDELFRFCPCCGGKVEVQNG